MKPAQVLLALVAVLAVGAVALLAGGGGDDDGGDAGERASGDSPPAGALEIAFAYSPEKEKLLAPLVEAFNAERVEVGGKPVHVAASVVASGDAEARIAAERIKPVVWSPASSLWGRLLNFEADRELAPRENESIVRTPLVIAMWEPMARALGWPRERIGFDDILRLARDERGWAAHGRPEFGPFKLVHTNPDFSTSGLSAVVAEYYAATGKKEGLTEAEVTGSKARRTVRQIERSIVHYGDTTLFIADQMRAKGPGYASAVAMEEVTLLDFNADRGGRDKLVALYPEEGTFFSDNPFIVLDAPWVSPEQAEGARAFQRFLAERITPEVAAHAGFRPADLETEPVAPVDEEHGADPSQPERVLGLPEPRVLAAIKKSWRADRKPADILLVLDTSGSMNDENRLDRAKDGLEVFFDQIAPQDSVGLMTFSDVIRPLLPIRPFEQARPELERTVRDLFADGGTAFYDATAEAYGSVREEAGDERINAVVLLTDGEDTDSTTAPETLVQQLEEGSEGAGQVRVFTIAYSASAVGAAEQLEEIARASGGQAYTSDTDDIEAVYRSISSFF